MTTFTKTVKRLSHIITKQPIDFAIACSFVVILALVELPLPIFMALLIDKIIPAGDITNLVLISIVLFSIRFGSSVFQVMQNYIVAKIVNEFTANIQKELIYRILRLPYLRFMTSEVHGLASRSDIDIQRVAEFTQTTIHFLIRPALSFIFIVALMLYWNLPLALYCLLIVPIVALTSRLIRKRTGALAIEQRMLTEKLEISTIEALNNIKIIRALSCEPFFTEKTNTKVHELEKNSVQFQIWTELSSSLIESVKSLSNIGFILFAAYQVFSESLTIGGFVALQTMAEGLRSPLTQIMFYVINFKSKSVALERINDVLEEKTEQPQTNMPAITTLQKSIEFKDVHYAIQDKMIIKGINLTIQKGEMVALVGPSGAGKTTITNLLLGLVKTNSGQILIDEKDLEKSDIYSFRKQIGVVYQESILFNQTIRYNMLVGNPTASDEQIYHALTIANAISFVKQLPKGIDSIIGVNGIKLSGGQQQRLSIARAVLANPAIMVLDEATSSLDSISEKEIKIALDQSLKGRTSIIIAHRLSTILNADQIHVLEDGKIVASGTHQSLLKDKNGLYYKLYQTQTEKLGYF